jgi:tRNA(Ile)-lysidine synthase
MKSNSRLSRQLESFFSSIPAEIERVVLAFSGGVDSCVLLHSLQSNSRPFKIDLCHINHGLQDIAGDMEAFCRSVAASYKLDIEVSHLSLDPDKGNLESEARKARYALFEQVLTPVDCLLTAHHADDQAETLLQNMLRGSGSAGLRGIAYRRSVGCSTLLRPLLDISRTEITAYAEKHQLEWYHDPSNLSHRFNRNYLRHEIIPGIKNRWPGYLESIRSVVSIQAETQQALDELGAQDYEQVRYWGEQENNDLLCCKSLLQLSLPRQKNLIRYWLKKNDCASLPHSRLNEVTRQMNSRVGSMPVVSASGYELRIYNQCLYIVFQNCHVPLRETYDFNDSVRLVIDEIDLDVDRKSIFNRLKQKDNGQSIKLKFRLNNKNSNPDIHRLKRLFQKHKIPPWKRMVTPQVYLNEELAGLWF